MANKNFLPSTRPMKKMSDLMKVKEKAGIKDQVFLIAYRAEFDMGRSGNDRAIYDDGIYLVAPNAIASFNANCDPGAFRTGIANLTAGRIHRYKIGIHGLSKPKILQYKALVQAEKMTVIRDDKGTDFGYFGINIHKGGYNKVSSIGCQTIYPDQWPSFIALVEAKMKEFGQKTIPYFIVE